LSKPTLFFWQNMPSHHQVGALDCLGHAWGAPVISVWCEDVSPLRRSQGWPSLERSHLQEIFLPQSEWRTAVDELIRQHPDAVHVFSGIGAYPQITYALQRVEQGADARYAVMAESPVMHGWRSPLRRCKSTWFYWPRRRRILGLLAMGEIAAEFYTDIGIPRSRIYPYAYQSPYVLEAAEVVKDTGRFVYFGQLDHRKGVDLLIKALAGLQARFRLDIIGDGPERAPLEALTRRLGLEEKISFVGTLPSAELQARLPGYAFAVVPSRFDGWGMAVNESLQAGLPVLVSDRVGAAELVAASGAGAVYPMESVQKLTELIQARLLDPVLLSQERAAALNYRDKLRPPVIGEYLKESLEHMIGLRSTKPTPPWLA
jgi:glycosyltransferase involved in cell wall biosynthesis